MDEWWMHVSLQYVCLPDASSHPWDAQRQEIFLPIPANTPWLSWSAGTAHQGIPWPMGCLQAGPQHSSVRAGIRASIALVQMPCPSWFIGTTTMIVHIYTCIWGVMSIDYDVNVKWLIWFHKYPFTYLLSTIYMHLVCGYTRLVATPFYKHQGFMSSQPQQGLGFSQAPIHRRVRQPGTIGEAWGG